MKSLLVLTNTPPSNPLTNRASQAEVDTYIKHHVDNNIAICIMLASMTLELQKQHAFINTSYCTYKIKN